MTKQCSQETIRTYECMCVSVYETFCFFNYFISIICIKSILEISQGVYKNTIEYKIKLNLIKFENTIRVP